jgi:hypothetical protein
VNNIKRGLSGTEESVEGLGDAVDQMEDVVNHLESRPIQNGVPQSTRENFEIFDSDIVTDSQKERYRREMIQEVDEIIDGISNLQRKKFNETITQRLAVIETDYQSPYDRIVRYHAIRMLLNGKARRKLKSVPHKIVMESTHLAEGVMAECKQTHEARIDELIEQERAKMVPRIQQRLREVGGGSYRLVKKSRGLVEDAGLRPQKVVGILRENSPTFTQYCKLYFRHGAISYDTYSATVERLKAEWLRL